MGHVALDRFCKLREFFLFSSCQLCREAGTDSAQGHSPLPDIACGTRNDDNVLWNGSVPKRCVGAIIHILQVIMYSLPQSCFALVDLTVCRSDAAGLKMCTAISSSSLCFNQDAKASKLVSS